MRATRAKSPGRKLASAAVAGAGTAAAAAAAVAAARNSAVDASISVDGDYVVEQQHHQEQKEEQPSTQTQTLTLSQAAPAPAPVARIAWVFANLAFEFLSVRDAVSGLGSTSRALRQALRQAPLRADSVLAPRTGRELRRLFRSRRRWNLTGVRLLDTGLDADVAKVVAAGRLEFLHLSCLCMETRPMAPTPLDLSLLRSLRELHIDDLMDLDSLLPLEACAATLRTVRLRRCSNLADVRSLRWLLGLRDLELRDCRLVRDVSVLRTCVRLRRLTLSGLDKVTHVSEFLEPCSELSHLSITRCARLKNACDGLEQLPLRRLEVQQVPSLESVPELACVPATQTHAQIRHPHRHHLTELVLSSCSNLRSVASLGALHHLQRLDLSNTNVSSLPALAALPHLRHLDLALCFRLVLLDFLRGSQSLHTLSLWRCASVATLEPLASCNHLVWLNISGISVGAAARNRHFAHVPTVVQEHDGVFAHRERRPESPGPPT